MDTRTGQIHSAAAAASLLLTEVGPYLMEMQTSPTIRQLKTGFVRRNDYCPCGSGKKFKRCCLNRRLR
jgi:uncharacterized protein YecA (UPF0149 family)